MKWQQAIIMLFVALLLVVSAAAQVKAEEKKPSILIVTGRDKLPSIYGDFNWYRQLNAHGLQLDTHFLNDEPARPFNWELISKYNCLIFLDLPVDGEMVKKGGAPVNYLWTKPPFREEMLPLLERYLEAGGGVFFLPDFQSYDVALLHMQKVEAYLQHWGARLPLESIHDPVTAARHPRNGLTYIYADAIAPSPVSTGVRGIWFPVGDLSPWSYMTVGQPIDVSKEWTPVVNGGRSSFTQDRTVSTKSTEDALAPTMYHRPNQQTPPTLYAIREAGNGRLALTVMWNIFTVHGGTSWIHDGVVIDKGLNGRPSDFGKLFENTLRWLSEPSLQNGKVGGYAQDPLQLIHPNLRKKPADYHAEFDTYQNPTPPGTVYRGLIGAHTAYSGGSGNVADYAAAATRAGLDFVVFLEQLGKISEADYRKLEADCQKNSTGKLLLIPGLRFTNNIGNPMFGYGFGIPWLKPSQLAGPNKDQLRTQCFDAKGELTYSDEDAKNWIWTFLGADRNIGYYDFSNNPGIPVRNLRLYGNLGVMTYRNGKLVEDITADYLDNVADGDPPLACAVDLVESPRELTAAVKAGHYLTHVAADSLAAVPHAMWYGHAYGRHNVYPSNGPQIKSWAETQRVLTYAGESFVPTRARVRPLLWLTSDVGLKEVVIYSETKPIRRLLLNGVKEYQQQFEWAFDRQRQLTVQVTDVKGHRAVSAALESWSDANANGWCGDRQNGELWHGPGWILPPRWPDFVTGNTWDGGPRAYIGLVEQCTPGVVVNQEKKWVAEGGWSTMGGRGFEGNMYPTCFDDSVANAGFIAAHKYAPGVVANAYHTLGPIVPTEFLTLSGRRTQYVQRITGPSEGHALFPRREGGNLALIESTVTLKKDVDVVNLFVMGIQPLNFAKNTSNLPLWAVRSDDRSPLAFGGYETFQAGKGVSPLPPVKPGGYLAMVPSQTGNIGIVFNVGTQPVQLTAGPEWQITLPTAAGAHKAGETFQSRLLVIHDALDETALNGLRVERLRRYLGLTGENGCGLKVNKGKVVAQFGLQDLAADNGLVDCEIPRPDFKTNIPLGLRFSGLNPNWAIGELQLTGYSPGFYTNGTNVYRSLGMDDQGLVHLAVYPDFVPNTHIVVGHPVQCDTPDLIIELALLNDKPYQYHVAVNNPTDKPIKTTLKKSMNLPAFDFPDTPVEVPAGGYMVIREK
ncbi:MAG TPA: hypothetical protein VGM23_12755 [Armatimonadota bacterium]|jgi:hypothetical protein